MTLDYTYSTTPSTSPKFITTPMQKTPYLRRIYVRLIPSEKFWIGQKCLVCKAELLLCSLLRLNLWQSQWVQWSMHFKILWSMSYPAFAQSIIFSRKITPISDWSQDRPCMTTEGWSYYSVTTVSASQCKDDRSICLAYGGFQ